MTTKTSVLIVGGGLSGLASAALLAHHGVRCMVVERHADTSIQYKFAGISPRSMEIFRSVGLEAEIRARRTGDQQAGAIARTKNLADPDIQWGGPAWPDASEVSPTQPATCDQHVLEPILRAHAERLGAVTLFNTEFVELEQDEHEVSARIRNHTTGEEETVIASYLIAVDGANGGLREKLGIGRSGAGALQHWMNVIFDTDMPPTLDGRRFTSCFVTDLNGTFTPREGGRWLLALQYSPENGQQPEDFDEAYCRNLIVKGAGRSDISAQFVDARPWEVAAYVADRFRDGRCFLLGDAAHVMPPTGAFGGNSGIHDAHNLAWKLAMVVKGQADPALLDSYDSERRPVAERTLAQALARLQRWFKDAGKRLPPPVEIVDDYDVVFGQLYRSGALIAESGLANSGFKEFRELSGQPGSRAPHFTIELDGRRLSTLDLFGREYVLLTGPDSGWPEAARRLEEQIGIAMRCYRFGAACNVLDPDGRWPDAFGVDPNGAVLVRPDGFVAWRLREGVAAPERILGTVLRQLGLRLAMDGERASWPAR